MNVLPSESWPPRYGYIEFYGKAALAEAGLFVSYADQQTRAKLGDLYDCTAPGVVVSSLPVAGVQAAQGSGVTLGVRGS